MIAPQILRSIANNVLHLVLMPTEACNFRCRYCYEDFKLARMEPGVVQGVKSLLSRRAPGLDQLELSWFGGEPLLALDVIEDISGHVRDLQAEHPKLQCSGEITTNGFLLSPRRFERLRECGVRSFQIPIEGPRRLHDQRRFLANGRGTFHRVWRNLLALHRRTEDLRVVLRLHVDPENAVMLPGFIARLGMLLHGDRRFPLFIRTVARLGGPHDEKLRFFERREGQEIVQRLRNHAADLGVPLHNAEEQTPLCYAARGNSYVVRADGRLNKCTVALEHPQNQVGRIDVDGSVHVEAGKMQQWMRGLWSGQREELECPMRGYADPVAASSAGDTETLRLVLPSKAT